MKTVLTETHDDVLVVTINRPEVRNAVDGATARALVEAFRAFDADSSMHAAVLTGAAGTFCAGADLKALAAGRGNTLSEDGDGPMGPTRMLLSKPLIGLLVRPAGGRSGRGLRRVLPALRSSAGRSRNHPVAPPDWA
jgi:enoyl-CoA hydratase